MTLEKIETGRGGAHQPAVAIHHFTEEEIEERRKAEAKKEVK
jgi:hypothetical protein